MGPFFSQQRSPFWFIKCEIFLKTNTPSLHNLPFQCGLAMFLSKISVSPFPFILGIFSQPIVCIFCWYAFPNLRHVAIPKRSSLELCNESRCLLPINHLLWQKKSYSSYTTNITVTIISTMSFSNSKLELMLHHESHVNF